MTRVALALLLAASGLLAQAPTPGPLIRLYPVAVDAGGQPVTDLTADDFKIVDQNKPESIFLFRTPKTEAPPPKLDVLEFTNRTTAARPHATVILFDLMNQNQPDRLNMWHVLDKSLPQLESGEFLYFYLLNLDGELVPIHPIGPRAADDATWPHDVAASLDKAMKAASHGRPVQLGQEDQAKKTFHQLEVLATQLAVFPGRRDIIWITTGMQNAYNPKLPCNGDWVDCALYVPHLAVTIAQAGVAVDPLSNGMDVATSTTAISGMDTPIGDKGQVKSIQGDMTSNQQGAQGTDPALDLTQMARLTGGHAYFRQDIRTVVKQVATDANGAYEIAYAPSADNWDNKFHVIHVTTTRPGVKVQVRERYYALADSRTPLDRTKAALMEAFQSPVDYSEIGLRVKFAPLDGKPGVHLEIRVDLADLQLHGQGGKYSGALYCLISDRNGAAPMGEPSVMDLQPELTAEQYKTALKNGLPINQDHPTSDATRQVRVIVLDQTTNEVGSITFPVK
jgi:VWFA-related protein